MAEQQTLEEYEVPAVLQSVGAIVRLVRRNYARDFALAVASPPESEFRQSYQDGIVFLVCLFASLVAFWGIILVAMKLYGKALGCAAGYAFSNGTYKNSLNRARQSAETSASHDDFDWPGDDQPQPDDPRADTDPHGYPQPSNDEMDAEAATTTKHARREYRVQICFLAFGMALTVSVILIFALAFNPLVAALDEVVVSLQEARGVLNETTNALVEISNASNGALALVTDMELNVTKLCPNFTSSEVETALGVDLESLMTFLNADYRTLALHVSANVSEWNTVLVDAENGVSSVEGYVQDGDHYVWVVPTVLIALCAVVALALAGCVMSKTRQSTQNFQIFLSMFVLPVLIVASLLCWLMATAAAAATSVASDACLPDSLSGSPDQTIAKALVASNIDATSLLYAYIVEYTSGCGSSNATDFIPSLQREVQSVTDFIAESLAKVDAVGLQSLTDYCAASDDELGAFLSQSGNLAILLAAVQLALESANRALSCDRIHDIYDRAVNETACGNLAGSVAWSFLLFLAVGISSMGMITLRASWQHEPREDNIYDENDVAENMIVDEHEEYLLYISKYKHEWEEYQGLDVVLPAVDVGSTDSLDNSSATPTNEDQPSSQNSHYDGSIEPFSLQSGLGVGAGYTDEQSQATAPSRQSLVTSAERAEPEGDVEFADFLSPAAQSAEPPPGSNYDYPGPTVLMRGSELVSVPSVSVSEEDSAAMLISHARGRGVASRYRMIPSKKARKHGARTFGGDMASSPRSSVLSCKRVEE